MATFTGTKGKKGKDGSVPTAGSNGGDETYAINGTIALDSTTVIVQGGDGGAGGNATVPPGNNTGPGPGPGAAGGNGGNASLTINGNIFQPASTSFDLDGEAVGGTGGNGGTGLPPGNGGNGGNASVTLSGNIVQTSTKLSNITIEAHATPGMAGSGGLASGYGNASATLNGNIIQYNGSTAANATMEATALGIFGDDPSHDGDTSWGTKTATLNGNIVQGNLNNVTLDADAESSNASATLTGNIVQTNASNTGTVTLEATGQHIDIEKNKVTLGNQTLNLTITELAPEYSAKIKGNEFTGNGTSSFVFSDIAIPGPSTTPDTIAIDLGAQTFVFNGDNNKLKGFDNATVAGSDDSTITGNTDANKITGGSGNDLLTGGAGNDIIDGGAGLFDTAVYTGTFSQYAVTPSTTPSLAITVTDSVSGRDGKDTLTNVEYLKFSDGLYDVAHNTFIPNTGTTNHAPAGTNGAVTTLEDTSYTFKTTDFGFSDPNDTPANNFAAVEITTLPTNGTLTDNGVAVTAGQFVTVADITANKLVFTPTANFNGAPSFTFQVQDDGGTAGGGQNTDQSPNTLTINVTSVNDAPAGTNNTVTMLEDHAHTFTAAEFGFTDPNDSPANNFLAVEITTLPTLGTLTDNGVAVTAGQFITVADIAANKLVYTPNANANGTSSFTFQVQDDGGVANGGQDTDQSPNTMGLTITSVNDAPAGTNGSVSDLKNTPYTFKTADFGFTDPNDSPANNFLAVEITTLPTNGTLTDNGVAVTAGQFVTVADIAANKLVFTPTANFTGAPTFTFQVQDDGGVANGGQDTDQSPNTLTINVTGTTHAPTGTDGAVTTLEDTAYTFKTADFGFTDPSDVPANNFTAVEITTLPANGTLTDNGVAVTAGQFVTVADIAANKLVFTPAANFNGAPTLTFQVQDDGSAGSNLDLSPNTLTINVTSVNDAPAGTNGAVTTLEDTAYTFKQSDFGFTDPNDSPANNFLSVEITTLPTNGTLTDNGLAVTAGQFITVADIAANKLVFTPTANFNGAPTFTFQVKDDGGVTNGGQDTDQSPNTLTINVTSVNDAPAGTNGAVTTLEDTAYTFKQSDFGFTDPNDSPANNLQAVEITTLPTNGTLTDNGVAVTAGQFITAADIAANKLVFTPAANFNGAPAFTFQVQDDGGVANGGQNTDQSPNTLTINVTSVNDAPVGHNDTINIPVNGSYAFAASDFGFTDPNDSPANNFSGVVISTLPANGSLTDNGTAVTAGQTINIADINAGKLVFTPAAGATGNDYGDFTFKVQDDGGTANGGQNTDTTARTMQINVASTITVNPGDSINAAIAAAHPGDTILINPGVYKENVLVNKQGITLQGTGPGVIIEGGFSNANGFANTDGNQSGLATWLQTAPGYVDANDNGVTVTADNVTLNNITVNDFYSAVTVSGASVSGLSLNDVTMQSSMFGFNKPDDTALNGLTIDGSTFADGYIGAGFNNDSGATGGAGAGKDATNTTITNSTFTNYDTKGVYMETAQGNTTLDGLTMTNVGAYGSVPSWGNNQLNGNGIDINLKYHTYAGTLDISGFNLTNTGTSNGTPAPGGFNENGAIVVEGRDDPSSYNGIPADVSGLTVNIHDGTITGTTTGIRTGEIKGNISQNDTGPAVTVTNVVINGATVSQIDNHTNSLLTVNGTGTDDIIESAQTPTSTGNLVLNGLGGNDTLRGGLGDDILNGGAGADTLIASPGSDTLNGGASNDTADFSLVTNGVNVSTVLTGFQNLGDYGEVKLISIENLTGTGFADILTGDSGNNTLIGGNGDDVLVASAGKDTLEGDAGSDTADFSNFTTSVTVSANATGFQTFDAAGDQVKLISIENLTGGTGDDTLTGNASNNILIGGAGNDVLKGGGGTLDIYNGGAGNDSITGTNGATTDVAYFSGLGSAYTITGTLGANGVTINGPDGTDTLNRIDRVKFLSPSHVADIDNNGNGDLIYRDAGTGAVTIVSNPGGTANTLTASPANNWALVGTGQFNPDGAAANARKAGILFQDSGTGDMELVTNINGSTSTTTALSSPTGTFAGFTATTTGDFNGDAASDILLWNSATKTAEIAFLNQNVGETVGTVDAVTTLSGAPSGANWAPIAAGDFNGDGKSDILWQNGPGGAVEITLMNGANVINTDTVPLNTAPGYTAVGTGDFDNDGKSDILLSTSGGSNAEIWTMNGDSVSNIYDVSAPGAGYTLKGAEDVNGDGYSDLLWQKGTQVVATEMTAGGNVLSTLNLTAPAGSALFASSGGG